MVNCRQAPADLKDRLRHGIGKTSINLTPAVLLLMMVCVTLSACASHSEIHAKMVDRVRLGYYNRAVGNLKTLEKEAPREDQIMYMMNWGMLLHLRGEYELSNKVFDAIERKLEKLYGVSISDELAAIAWNDSAKSFQGEEFERIMIHAIMAFNYLHLGQLEEAGVEARLINHKLQVYVDKLARNKVKSIYVQDPFAQFLSGLIHEALGDLNAAFRSYEDALNGYADLKKINGVGAPAVLQASVLRVARNLDYTEAVEKYEPEFGKYDESDPSYWENKGRLIVISALGEIAHKASKKWKIPDPQLDFIVVTYPKFVRGRFLASRTSVKVDEKIYSTVMAHNLSTLAIKVMDDKNAQVKARAVVKAMARYALKKVTKVAAMKTKNNYAKAAAIIGNVVLNVQDLVEAADTRSWMTLPDQYRISVIPVEPGVKDVEVACYTGTGAILDTQEFHMHVGANESRFLVARCREAGDGPLVNDPAEPVEPVDPNVVGEADEPPAPFDLALND